MIKLEPPPMSDVVRCVKVPVRASLSARCSLDTTSPAEIPVALGERDVVGAVALAAVATEGTEATEGAEGVVDAGFAAGEPHPATRSAPPSPTTSVRITRIGTGWHS
jgi:hypothetical protein